MPDFAHGHSTDVFMINLNSAVENYNLQKS